MVPRQKRKPIPFEIIQLGKTGRKLGWVYAADEEAAHAAAIVQFKIRDPRKVRLLVRRARTSEVRKIQA